MGLISLATLGDSMQITFDPASPAGIQAQRYIDKVSAYILSQTNFVTPVVTLGTVRAQSDFYGEIELKVNPVTAVTSVVVVNDPTQKNILTTDVLFVTDWAGTYGLNAVWDHQNGIAGLFPHQWVDIIMTYGSATVPLDLATLVEDAVIEALTGAGPSSLQSLAVGDRVEEYRQLTPLVESLGADVLASYRTTETTYRLGELQHPKPFFWNY